MTKETLMQLADAYAMPNGGVTTYAKRDAARQALSDAIDVALKQARIDALEEAAKVCDGARCRCISGQYTFTAGMTGERIRALKDKHD